MYKVEFTYDMVKNNVDYKEMIEYFGEIGYNISNLTNARYLRLNKGYAYSVHEVSEDLEDVSEDCLRALGAMSTLDTGTQYECFIGNDNHMYNKLCKYYSRIEDIVPMRYDVRLVRKATEKEIIDEFSKRESICITGGMYLLEALGKESNRLDMPSADVVYYNVRTKQFVKDGNFLTFNLPEDYNKMKNFISNENK